MSEITLQDVLALNDELAALAEVGIPSQLAPQDNEDVVAEELSRIDRSLTLRSDLGQSLIAATTENGELPPVYRSALEAGLRSNRLSATLDALSRTATAEGKLRGTLTRSLISPLIILGLAYLGLIVLCLVYAPTVENMYVQVGQTPGWYTQVLMFLRTSLPIWAIGVPLLMFVGVLLWRCGRGNWQRLVPGSRRYQADTLHANFAHQLGLLLENGLSMSESLPVAAAVTEDQTLIAAAHALSRSHAQENTLPADSQHLRPLPPLLRWALTGDLGEQSLPEILLFAEMTYRSRAQHRAATWRVVLPTAIGVTVGGLIVLAYGLCLFGPFSQLLEGLAARTTFPNF
ncbi:type II secretion system F family protein [Adhaeretor mobilis]|uniref:Type II secretion system protein F n=1 Tax=Adhaeretor mobilis TaxID=1930276 RepID=A0A517N0Y4_9BACT|nr:type II secretion system F family protein [Adhaeretor mobilis]QDT00795.1 Type II secretion system protein F [Adhaeretor mobilis]